MKMLELALKARLPLIRVETDDVFNVSTVLAEVAGEALEPLQDGFSKVSEGLIYYLVEPNKVEAVNWYGKFGTAQATLVIVNPVEEHPMMFDGGTLTTPTSMISDFVGKYYGGDHPEQLVIALSGLSYKDVVEIAKLAMAQHGALTVKSVQDMRRIYFGSVRGLQQVPTELPYYYSNKNLNEWLKVDGKLMIDYSSPPELRPRGLLFTGPPGTGKTMGAKHLANELGLPLYVLEVGILMSKYVGESEKNMQRCLSQAENSAPCILLVDEVEKLFQQGDESGVTTRLLSHLLWWLQEHRAKVFVVMTTNNQDNIPPELYRPGRIDKDISFQELPFYDGGEFIRHLLLCNNHLHNAHAEGAAKEIRDTLYQQDQKKKYSHAELTRIVMDRLKLHYLKNNP